MKVRLRSTILAVFCGLACLMPAAAHAQNSACVNLLVGAGYAAKMNVYWSGGSTGWSGAFAIGQTKCQSLSGVPVGAQYTVEVYAILGKTVDCNPHPLTKVNGGPNAVFNAWGTTLNVHCEMPDTGTAVEAEMNKAGRTPSAKGAAAAKTAEADAKKSPPPQEHIKK